MVLILALVLFTIVQPYLPGQFNDKIINNDENGMQIRNQAPNSIYWFGTNSIGQDLWSNVWAGTRNSLLIGLCVAIV